MPDDVPADARAVVSQLLAETRERLGEWDDEQARTTLATIETVSANKLPEGDRRERLLHGCERVEATLAENPETAMAYLRAMEDVIQE